jgi:methylated-DNA-[protein]-cysteine S-methyltransferase
VSTFIRLLSAWNVSENPELHDVQVPLGTLRIAVSSAGKINRLDWIQIRIGQGWVAERDRPQLALEMGLGVRGVEKSEPSVLIQNLRADLRRFFSTGEPLRQEILEILEFAPLTEFQRAVYRATFEVPHGETRSYAWVAEKIRKPSAMRAVGQALKRNPFLLLIPCHRVISSCGALGGFMGQNDVCEPETYLKSKLLELERSYRNPVFPFLKIMEAQTPWIASAG